MTTGKQRVAAHGGGHRLAVRVGGAGGERGTAIIAPPHPMYGGRMDDPVIEALETALGARGLSTLAFDYRGVGDSGGVQRGELADAVEDLVSVARCELAAPPLVLAGYSFGACAAVLAAAELDAAELWLVAPAIGLLGDARPDLRRRLRVVVGDRDDYAPVADLRAWLAATPDVRLQVLPGTDHFFAGRLDRLVAALDALADADS